MTKKRKQNPSAIGMAALFVMGAAALGLLAAGTLLPTPKEKKKPKAATKPATKTEPPPKKTPPAKKTPPTPPDEPDEPEFIDNGITVNPTCTKLLSIDRTKVDDLMDQVIPDFLDTDWADSLNMNTLAGFWEFLTTSVFWGILHPGTHTRSCPGYQQAYEKESDLSKFEFTLMHLLCLRMSASMFEAELVAPEVFSEYIEATNVLFTEHDIDNEYLQQVGFQ